MNTQFKNAFITPCGCVNPAACEDCGGSGIVRKTWNKSEGPLNVTAILEWLFVNRRECYTSALQVFGSADESLKGVAAIALQAFEAGREFERAYPDVESGAGYLGGGK